MAFSVPTYQQIRDRVLADIEAKLGAEGYTSGPVEYAIGAAVAGASYLLHVAIARVARNKVPTLADDITIRLWAAFFGVPPKPATKNIGSAVFPATIGTSILAGTILRLRNGVEFVVDATANYTAAYGGSIEVTFTAVLAGAAGRSAEDTPIFLGSPVAGVTTQGNVPAGISGGADAESTTSVLERLLERLRNPPKGGTVADWISWAKATPGVNVANAFVMANIPPEQNGLGPSSVLVLFTVTGDNPIPLAGDVTLVDTYIEQFAPADLLDSAARAPTPQPMNPTIKLAPYPDLTVQAAVTASLRAMLATDATPGGTVLLSRINEAISIAAGETNHLVVSPVADVAAAGAQTLVTLGTPSYASF